MSAFTIRPVLYTSMLSFSLLIASCTGLVEAPDEGAGSSTGVAVCSSNAYWKDMDKGSELMRPGGKCNDCHDKNPKSPKLSVAGTLYPTAHEPDECNGVSGGSTLDGGLADFTIIITDRTGQTLPDIPVNSVGNFQRVAEVLMPFNVKVRAKGGKENKMLMQAPHGDCNACHTQGGSTTIMGGAVAPGRVTVP
jgi:hypothetical protein